LLTWQRAQHKSEMKTLPQWESAASLEHVLQILGVSSGVPCRVDALHETLAHALFVTTDEGKWIRSVLGDDVESARMPLETIFPFSILNFESRDDELAQRARQALNRAVAEV
ncbi:MAG: hypothetical protein L0Y55_12045, partial [Anaerolineales bacterium]|nr:hypothetical protein [Anaerolineales bacterium]